MKKISLLIVLFLLIFTLSVYASTESEKDTISTESSSPFSYNITPDNDEWVNFESRDEMIKACFIPTEIASKMTTEELIEVIYEYPMLNDIMYYNNANDGLEVLKKECNAYYELLTRKNSGEKLIEFVETKNLSKEAKSLRDQSIKVLLSDKNMIFSDEKQVEAEKILSTSKGIYVYTPTGVMVSVISYGELLSYDDKKDYKDDVEIRFPNASFLSEATTKYNCHSYAWYLQSTSNTLWMPNPYLYMNGNDPSYDQVSSPMFGSRVFYSIGGHSALITSAQSNSLSNTDTKSKWGQGPLMAHKGNYCPYSTVGVSYWD